MSRLNGTKWKGAKLRIGEARPDFNAGYVIISAVHGDYELKKRPVTEHVFLLIMIPKE